MNSDIISSSDLQTFELYQNKEISFVTFYNFLLNRWNYIKDKKIKSLIAEPYLENYL